MARKAAQSHNQTSAAPMRFGNRKQLAARYTERYGLEVSPRTLERWPLRWRIVNGEAVAEIAEFDRIAQQRIDAAPVIMGGAGVERAA